MPKRLSASEFGSKSEGGGLPEARRGTGRRPHRRASGPSSDGRVRRPPPELPNPLARVVAVPRRPPEPLGWKLKIDPTRQDKLGCHAASLARAEVGTT
jgi:hypothetical protein